MKENLRVKEQFNKQAGNFDRWPITQNEKILESLCRFFDIEPEDSLLDFACGTGAFAIYAAQRAGSVQGVDISEGMIEVAVEGKNRRNLGNVGFLCCDVEKVPFEDGSFDCVVSKSAFHHMKNYKNVFREMKRCCSDEGRVGLQDIVLYGNEKIDRFFEDLELEIDACHNYSLSKKEVVSLYKENDIEVVSLFCSTSELNFFDYVNHAVQSEEARSRVLERLGAGLNDPDISNCFCTKNDTLFWKRDMVTILGNK